MRTAYYAAGANAYAAGWRLRSLRRSRRVFLPRLARDPDAPALVLSPHLDDAVISCWHVLTSVPHLRVVNVFAGIPPPGFVTRWDRACGAEESAAHVRSRIDEDREILAAIGHEPEYFPFTDAQYTRRRPDQAALDAVLAERLGSARAIFAPAGLGFAHGDHLLVRAYARTLARHGMRVTLYADLPYAVRRGDWPRWIRDGGGAADGLRDWFWAPALRAVAPIRAVKIVALPAQAARAKLAAMRGYATQFPGLDHDGRLSDPSIHGFEVYWTLGRGGRGG